MKIIWGTEVQDACQAGELLSPWLVGGEKGRISNAMATRDAQRLQRREIPELPKPERLRNLPAWLLSLMLHVGCLVTLSLLWVAQPKGTGGEPDRPVGVAVVYEANGGEAYFLKDAGAASLGASDSTTPSEELANALPASSDLASTSQSLLAGLLPNVGVDGGSTSQAAGGLGLGDGGAVLGGDRNVPKVKTSVFGIEGEGTRFIYVFDRSQSMLGYNAAPLKSAKSELLNSLQSLGPMHQFQIVFYNDSPLPFGGFGNGGPKLFTGDERSKEAAMRFVRDVSADGGTQHVDALRMALNLGPDVVFFLTDADSSPSQKEIESLQTKASRSGTTIHTIQFGSGPSRNAGGWLKILAEGTGGKFRYVDVTSL